ncbi:MAG: DUF2516 family protein [Acidimicrobiia bacterium]
MNLGPSELLLLLLLLVPLGLTIWVIVDVTRFPQAAFQSTGHSRTLWLVLPIVALVACGLGSLIVALVYAVAVRPKLVTAGDGPT